MTEIFLFDWGDTLMVDFPGVPGKMCDWAVVEAVDGARETLEYLSGRAAIYIATGAADSTEAEIRRAFSRAGLSGYISGYFCKANLGVAKGSPAFLPTILARLGKPAERVVMVGDDLVKDIKPAAAAGIRPIWLDGDPESAPVGTRVIAHLDELRGCRNRAFPFD